MQFAGDSLCQFTRFMDQIQICGILDGSLYRRYGFLITLSTAFRLSRAGIFLIGKVPSVIRKFKATWAWPWLYNQSFSCCNLFRANRFYCIKQPAHIFFPLSDFFDRSLFLLDALSHSVYFLFCQMESYLLHCTQNPGCITKLFHVEKVSYASWVNCRDNIIGRCSCIFRDHRKVWKVPFFILDFYSHENYINRYRFLWGISSVG